MKNLLATHSLPDEYFVLQIDGRVTSGHRRFIDALRATLLLRQQSPQRDIEVRSVVANQRCSCRRFALICLHQLGLVSNERRLRRCR